MTPAPLAALLPFVSALPQGTPVNVNTAPPEVLAAIVDDLTPERAEALLADRAASHSRRSPSSAQGCRAARSSRATRDSPSRAATS
jgi:general secretion pathway protein K